MKTIGAEVLLAVGLMLAGTIGPPLHGGGWRHGNGWSRDRKPGGCCTWRMLEKRQAEFGLSETRIAAMLAQCRESGLSADEAETLLEPVLEANQDKLPAECVFTKVKEGLAKQISVEHIVAVARKRLECLRRARKLLAVDSPGRGARMSEPPGLVAQVGLLLEEGFPESALEELLRHHGNRCYGRLLHVLEAGEALQLAGIAVKDAQQFMDECLKRHATRPEIRRAVEYILLESRKGRPFEAIHAGLWPKNTGGRHGNGNCYGRGDYRGNAENDGGM